MLKFLLFFLLTIAFLEPVTGQKKFNSFKNHCGLYYRNMEILREMKEKEINFYKFHPGETVASIGAQCGNWEASFAALSDSVEFYLEDIDSSFFNQKQIAFAWNYYDSIRGKPITSSYQLVLGNEKQTLLPDNLFDKILIINSFHEFSYQDEMLSDIAKKLKPRGLLFIDEALARKSGELHGVCHKQIYLNDELINILKKTGFDYVDGLEMNFRKSKPVRKIFAFRKMN